MVDLSGLGDKAKEFMSSDKGEEVTDGALDKAGNTADKVTGGKFDDQINGARDAADNKLGE